MTSPPSAAGDSALSFRSAKRTIDLDAAIEEVKKCQYLPEDQMITLCNMYAT